MINLKPHEKIGTVTRVLCALSLAVACAPAWSDVNKPKYEMAVFTDAEQGSKILSGKYDQAIEKFNARSRPADSFHAQTNLCVAYAKSGNIKAAEEACDEAVVAAKSLKKVRATTTYGGPSSSQIRARYVAIALSNRGVVKAVQGDLEAAKQDFEAAMAQRSRISTIEANLDRLNAEDESV